jgi:hypothetical protein
VPTYLSSSWPSGSSIYPCTYDYQVCLRVLWTPERTILEIGWVLLYRARSRRYESEFVCLHCFACFTWFLDDAERSCSKYFVHRVRMRAFRIVQQERQPCLVECGVDLRMVCRVRAKARMKRKQEVRMTANREANLSPRNLAVRPAFGHRQPPFHDEVATRDSACT